MLLAKDSVESFFSDSIEIPEHIKQRFSEKRGVFVTLKKKGELRGCIGYTHAIYPLYQAVYEAARAAAFDDPRFPPIEEGELKDLEYEVSVLTPPKRIEPPFPEQIRVGTDGLLVRMQGQSGLLLPQVATEWGWDSEKFLSQTCLKAGLAMDAWKDSECEVYIFQGEKHQSKSS